MREPRRVKIPATCTRCGAVFDVLGMNISAAQGVNAVIHLSGNIIDCTYCGGRAQVIEGIFTIADDVLKIVQANPLSEQVLRQFLWELRGEAVTKLVERGAEIVDAFCPPLASLMRKYPRSALAIAALAIVAWQSPSPLSDGAQLLDRARNEPPAYVLPQNDYTGQGIRYGAARLHVEIPASAAVAETSEAGRPDPKVEPEIRPVSQGIKRADEE